MVHLRSQLKGFSESGMLSEKEKDKMELPTSFRVNAGFMGNLVTASNEGQGAKQGLSRLRQRRVCM